MGSILHGDVTMSWPPPATPAAVVIPKVDGPEYLDEISSLLEAGGAPPSTQIWAMVETPTGILNVNQIANHERMSVMVMRD